MTTFNDRMLAVHNQLTAMKQDVIAAQNSVYAKQGNGVNYACKVKLLPSSSTGTMTLRLLPGRPLVLGLPAVPHSNETNDEQQEEIGSESKKRKRLLALQNGESFVADGDM